MRKLNENGDYDVQKILLQKRSGLLNCQSSWIWCRTFNTSVIAVRDKIVLTLKWEVAQFDSYLRGISINDCSIFDFIRYLLMVSMETRINTRKWFFANNSSRSFHLLTPLSSTYIPRSLQISLSKFADKCTNQNIIANFKVQQNKSYLSSASLLSSIQTENTE